MVDSSGGDSTELQTVDIGSVELDIFALAKRNKRKVTFVTITKRLLEQPLQNLPQISDGVLTSFLERIWQTQRDYNVSYHNEMHNLDVAQMTHILLNTGTDCISVQLRLSPLEQFAAIIASVCHDFAHDGFNNGYHVNTQSPRFQEHGSIGVQEKFHFAESFKVVEQMQLLAGLAPEQQVLFKKRMQQCIYSTDMSRHVKDLNEVKALLEQIPEGTPILPLGLEEAEQENRKSKFLELVVHASDISFLSRPR